ncbi:MAG: MBL fold metallo-hydrolase [SAR202 cluster bacterium]|mgnify:CR=1 FL=1|jgi:glyoxylase-like metal-dependent hydrolase (beta-lactamase superfamily II)|nr:MBL fold metallo-hydrolase [SAR202 cluster bacterium]MDP7105280.1 MBL fold metallo-hydrolase [SAR202 cluster bacterium]MDP7226858.1 MBL fold metallo-hydrolase [SAR202 cluster bacterium]MDP7413077.1 MBL fold metallo-hydrolase [SAR202 cluster bacterium]MDP7534897.1 MBL fold metallo-hydrolase [SAR202 cluster bacterium]|tara:strand:- start:1003 stop:1842 length:840 start_codon:yes stop_codon:yes gene_type:complete
MTTPGTELIELETGVYARLHAGLTNAGILVGDDSVLVIDSLRVPSFARDLIQDVRHITDKPIQYVIDTHAHWDHSWGNEEFPDSVIIGHQNCYDEMVDVEWNRVWRDKIIASSDPWADEAKIVKITPPNLTFETSMQLYFGGRKLELRYFGRAHTSGDIIIFMPNEKLAFTGDVVQDKGVPFFGDSYPEDWPDTDDGIAELAVDRFVAGHGPIGNHDGIVEARNFIHTLVPHLQSAIKEGQDSASATASALDAMSGFSDWRGFENLGDTIPLVYGRLTR